MLPIVSMITLISYVIILGYLTQLQQVRCTCALTWKRTYIVSFIGVILFINLIALLLNKNKHLSITMMFVMITASIFNAILMIQYVSDLKKSTCICKTSMNQDFAHAVMLFIAFFKIFFVLFIILGFLFLTNIFKK
jgi:hypothetical protein